MAAVIHRGVEYGRPLLRADAVPIDTAAPADVAVLPVPPDLLVRGYRVAGLLVYNTSATPVLAQLSLRSAEAGGGAAIVVAAVLTALDAAGKVLAMVVADGGKLTAANLYVHLAVANVAAATVSIKVLIEPL